MEPIANDEDTVRKLCVEANTERDRVKLRDVRSRLEAFLREHARMLTSMSEDTYKALRKLKGFRVRHRASR
jgi:hypothetical protein